MVHRRLLISALQARRLNGGDSAAISGDRVLSVEWNGSVMMGGSYLNELLLQLALLARYVISVLRLCYEHDVRPSVRLSVRRSSVTLVDCDRAEQQKVEMGT